MRVIIAGSRHIVQYSLVKHAIHQSGWMEKITEVVCGGASGVDYLGQKWAMVNNIPVKKFLPDWDTYGKQAGPIRNAEMAAYADALILVWDGKSRGSASMWKIAKSVGILRYQLVIEGNEVRP